MNETDLVITTNLQAPDDSFTIPGVKGTDGVSISNIAVADNERDINFEMSDGSSYTVVGIGTHVVGADIDVDGKLALDLSDGSTLVSTNVIRGRDGNGVGVQDVEYVDGQITVTLINPDGTTTEVDAGNTSIVNVTGSRLDVDEATNTGILFITMSDGSEIEVGNIYGEDGRYITRAELVDSSDGNKDLVLTFDNGSTVNAGNSTGEPGRSIVDANVSFGGDLTITYSDDSVDLAGNLGSGAGLSVWDSEKTPYVKDQVVIHDGGLYISTEANNSTQPPSDSWTALALGDQLVEIRKPKLLSPISGQTAYSIRPELKASVFAPIVSSDVRDTREFEIDVITGDFTAPIYTFDGNVDSHRVNVDLELNTSYKWRTRDTSTRGEVSAWSDEEEFAVPEGIVEMPEVSLATGEDPNDAFIAPNLVSSSYVNNFDSEPHVSTDWQVLDGDVVVWESLNSDELTSIIVPNDVLVKGESYTARVRHRSTNIESPWSDELLIIVSTMDYAETPIIVQTANGFESSGFKKTPELALYDTVELINNQTIWTIKIVETGEKIIELINGGIGNTYNPINLDDNVEYVITVTYINDRFGVVAQNEGLMFHPTTQAHHWIPQEHCRLFLDHLELGLLIHQSIHH